VEKPRDVATLLQRLERICAALRERPKAVEDALRTLDSRSGVIDTPLGVSEEKRKAIYARMEALAQSLGMSRQDLALLQLAATFPDDPHGA